MVTWVTGQCGVSTSTARQWVRSAANLESLPCLAEGLASGEMSLDLVEPLAEVASVETDAALREASAHWSVRQARQLVAWHRAHREAAAEAAASGASASGCAPGASSADGGESDTQGGGEQGSAVEAESLAAREFDRRTLRFNDTRRTMWVAFTKDDYATAKSALVTHVAAGQRQRDATRGGEQDQLGYVPYDQRLYDTMMCLFRVESVSGPEGGPPIRPRVVVHAPLELLLSCTGGQGGVAEAGAEVEGTNKGTEKGTGEGKGVAEVEGVGPVSAEVARRLACDAHVVLSVESDDGRILDQGRARRDPTVAQRIEIARRDKGCRFPGCTYTEFTDVHHIRHWVHGGATDLDNLVTLCDRHHRAVHELGWAMEGDANAVVSFTTPHGRVIRSVPSPTWRRSWSAGAPRDGPLRR